MGGAWGSSSPSTDSVKGGKKGVVIRWGVGAGCDVEDVGCVGKDAEGSMQTVRPFISPTAHLLILFIYGTREAIISLSVTKNCVRLV